MKKIDKLILVSFIGPFILTFIVVVFILLSRHMLLYFDDIIGKGLGLHVVGQLLFYFSIFMIPTAMPLAILLSSLIVFGNLGEHGELMAIKGAGISLLRVLRPIFFFTLALTFLAFYANNYLVPKAALEAYTLIFDIKQKKPAMELRAGVFYNDIPGISIKVNTKFTDDENALKEIILYDHSVENNEEVIVADSGRMTPFLNERFLKFELFNGLRYSENQHAERAMIGKDAEQKESMTRSKFTKTEMVYDLSSFALTHTDKRLFENDRLMRNLAELDHDIDSLKTEIAKQKYNLGYRAATHFKYYMNSDSVGIELSNTTVDSVFNLIPDREILQSVTNVVRERKAWLESNSAHLETYRDQQAVFEIQWHKILANSSACIIMFLIGAPLGAIIRRGGLGVPFLISISFFIIYYILSLQGTKSAQHAMVSPLVGVWATDVALLIVGLIFLRQAQTDARLFEADSYAVSFQKIRKRLSL
jgi:lipopolysaccharide export system permease protein